MMADPYLQSAVQTHVQDGLAQERKKERDRIAQELMETLSQKMSHSQG